MDTHTHTHTHMHTHTHTHAHTHTRTDVSLGDFHKECVCSHLAILTVRLAVLPAVHKKAYNCEFGGFENVWRDAGIRAIPSTDIICYDNGYHNPLEHGW